MADAHNGMLEDTSIGARSGELVQINACASELMRPLPCAAVLGHVWSLSAEIMWAMGSAGFETMRSASSPSKSWYTLCFSTYAAPASS